MIEEIKKFFKGDVLNDEITLRNYSHDASLFEIAPKIVAYPKDSEDVKNLVKWVSENKSKYPELSITARSAGTDMTGGPLNDSIILDFTRYMNKFIGLNSHANATVQPGMFYRDFEKITLEKGLIMPSYPASKSICAVGGMFANNSGGEKTLRYGKTEDYVKSVKIVLSDGNEYEIKSLNKIELEKKISQNDTEGNLYKNIKKLIEENREIIKNSKPNVSKNSAGYYIWNVESDKSFDLNKLLVGSQGTLGIVTEITFKLIPAKKYSRLAVIYLKDLKNLGQIVNKTLKLNPESMESYDDHTLKIATKLFYEFLKGRGFFGGLKFMFNFVEDFLMILTGGIPKLILLVEFAEDDMNLIDQKMETLKKSLGSYYLKFKITKSEIETRKYWDIRHESFNLLRKHVKGRRTAPFIDDFIVRPEFLPEFLPKLEAILSKYNLLYTIAGHPGNGNFHIIPLIDKSTNVDKIILELSEKVYSLVLEHKGSITAEHNDGIIRTPFLLQMYGEKIINIFKEVKRIFDPLDIFNPGKKTFYTKNDITRYLAK